MPVPDSAALVARLRAAGCVFAEDEAALLLEAAEGAELERLVARRVAGEPLEHVLGWAAFAGLRIPVEPGVFVPRRRTELLAEEAIRLSPALAVELCCGAAPVAAVLAAALPGARLHAADLDPAAVRVAARTLAEPIRAGRAAVHEGDLFAALPAALRGSCDVIVANAPYVPTDAIPLMPSEARDHEPALALDGGSDGLALHRRIAAEAPAWLAPGGTLLIETSEEQASGTAAAMEAAGLETRVLRDEDRDATAVAGRRSAGTGVPVGEVTYSHRTPAP